MPNILNFDGLEYLISVDKFSSVLRTTLDFTPLNALVNVNELHLDVWFDGLGTPISLNEMFPGIEHLNEGFFLSSNNYGPMVFTGLRNLISAGTIYFNQWGAPDFLTFSLFDAFDNLESCYVLNFDFCFVEDFVNGFEQLQHAESIWLDMSTSGIGYPDFGALESVVDLSIYTFGLNIQSLHFTSLVDASIVNVVGTFNELYFEALESLDHLYLEQDVSDTTTSISFPALDSIYGGLGLYNLASSDLYDLFNLNFIGGSVVITDCQNLSNCAIAALCERLAIEPLSVVIMGNAPGCNTNEEVQIICSLSSATGLVFADINCNGSWNAGDVIFPNVIVQDLNNMPIGSSNFDGSYHTSLPDNMTTVIHAATPSGFFPGPDYTFITTNMDEVFSNYDFPLCPDLNFHDVRVYAHSGQPRPGFYHSYQVYVANDAVPTENVLVTFDISNMPGASIFNTNGTISGNTVTWIVNDLTFLESYQRYVQIYVDPTTPLGTIYTPILTATLLSAIADNDPSDNVFSFDQTVVSSYDPNDKSVNMPALNMDEINAVEGVWLDYTIQFQNTGTAEAINVRVDDIIEEDLDLTTFQMLDASHPFQLSFDENRKVEWLFENIMLPDTSSNEEASHGYIHFRIRTKNNLSLSDTISNKVAIYFDFNEPVITNTATTVFYTCPEPAVISGITTLCEDETLNLMASETWEIYNWLENDNLVSSSEMLELNFLTAGTHSFLLHTSQEFCFNEQSVDVNVIAVPEVPVISQFGNTLTTSGTGSFIWTLNGEVLSDEDNSIEFSESGIYAVTVVSDNCSSPEAIGNYQYVAIDENSIVADWNILPNPASSFAIISGDEFLIGQNELIILDVTGKSVRCEKISAPRFLIDTSDMAAGVYLVSIKNQLSEVSSKRLIIE